MLMRFDPLRELDRLSQAWGSGVRSAVVPMDAYRRGEQFVVHFDLPGVDPSSIDLTVEKNALTVSASRRWQHAGNEQVLISERPQGTFTRQLFLGESLNLDGIQAGYEDGVLTVTIPVAEQAKSRKVEIGAGGGQKAIQAGSQAA